MNPDDVLYGHWHQPYKPPWWRVIKRWKLRRRRIVVPGSLTHIDRIPHPEPRVGRFVQFEELSMAEQQRIERWWFGR